MRRREFIAGIGGTVAAPVLWPVPTQAQQAARMRRVGLMLSGLPADDREAQARITAFVQGLQERGWTDGRNVRIDYRFGLCDPDRQRKYATELVMLAPDVVLAGGNGALAAFQQVTSTLPIVFAHVVDPVGLGYVATLARPGGNATGFMQVEFSLSVKWLELLKQIAPGVTRAVVVRNPGTAYEVSQFAAIQAVAPSLRMEVTPVGREADEIERGVTVFAREPKGGLIVTGQFPQIQPDHIIALAARHRLPAVYPFRGFVTAGGLISFGNDQAEPYRLAAGYVDRILKGEKPADLPVQAPTKFETIINLKTAKALGIDVPPDVLVRAGEVIE